MSEDGRYIGFSGVATNLVPGDTNGWSDIFVHDRESGLTERVSASTDGTQANRPSFGTDLSANGRLAAFYSFASNLVSDDTNGVGDVFVHDRASGVTERVSVASDGEQGNGESNNPTLSPDGRYVVFASAAGNNIVQITVMAEYTTATMGRADADAFVGKRTLVVEPTKASNHEGT